MRNLIASLILLTSLTGICTAAEPAETIKKAREAVGGEKWTADGLGQTWKAKGKMQAAGQSIEYTGQYTFAGAGRLWFRIEAKFGGQEMIIAAGSDGKNCWETDNTTLRDMAPKKAEEFLHTAYLMEVCHLVGLTDKAYRLEPLKDMTVNQTTLQGIKVQREGKRPIELYFDSKTGLLDRAITQVHDEFTDKEVTQTNIFSDYKMIDGKKVMTKFTMQRDGKDFIVEEMSEWKPVPKLDHAIFQKPKK
jgi:hypothetical protein